MRQDVLRLQRFDNATEQALSEGWGRFKSQINHLFLLPRPTRNSRLQRHYAHRSKRVHCNRLDPVLRQVLSETVPAPKPPKSVAKKTKKTKAPPPQMADTAFQADKLSKLKDRQGTPRCRHLPPDHRGATAETQTFCRTLLLKAYQISRWKKCSAIRGRGRDWEAAPTSAPAIVQAPSQREDDKLEDEIFGQGLVNVSRKSLSKRN